MDKMIYFKYLGNIEVKSSTKSFINSLIRKHSIQFIKNRIRKRDICQLGDDFQFFGEDLSKKENCDIFDSELNLDKGNLKEFIQERSILLFGDVPCHNDGHLDEIYTRGKALKGGFYHWVVEGCFELSMGKFEEKLGTEKDTYESIAKKSMIFKAGDFFVMNPSVDHQVKLKSARHAVTMCFTGPLYWNQKFLVT